MLLLRSSPLPSPEFASLSFLLKEASAAVEGSCHMAEPMMLASTVSTLSHATSSAALKELHQHLTSLFKIPGPNTKIGLDQITQSIFHEDEKQLGEVQVFRPLCANGMGLYYRLLQDKPVVSKFMSLLLPTKSNTGKTDAIESQILGVILCVGISGMAPAHSSSSLTHTLSQRIHDCLDLIARIETEDSAPAKALLTTMLLVENEDRITNAMAEAATTTLIPELDSDAEKGKGVKSPIGAVLKTKKSTKTGLTLPSSDARLSMDISSGEKARIATESLSVMSVVESDTILRRYASTGQERRANLDLVGSKMRKTPRRRKSDAKDVELDEFYYKGPTDGKGSRSSFSAPTTSSNPILQLRQSKNDKPIRPIPPKSGSFPTLMAPRSDRRGSALNSKRGLRALGKKSVSGLRKQDSNDALSIDMFDDETTDASGELSSQQPSYASTRNLTQEVDTQSHSSNQTPTGSVGSRTQDKRKRNSRRGDLAASNTFDPFGAEPAFSKGLTIGDGTVSTSASSNSNSSKRSFSNRQLFEDDGYPPDTPSSAHFEDKSVVGSFDTASDNSRARLQVNVALNEDLTCSYQQSEMASCSVEGSIQIQVKTASRASMPFNLLITDPSRHIESLHENKKFATSLPSGEQDADYALRLSVPKADIYVPVLKYKCSEELHPVPIRVQTRVKMDELVCRVALQISSNPNNVDSLTDLTIIMGVPPEVVGETLQTSPAGGVWNASRRTVIWCVSELGGGEKFQLQARFEMNGETEKPVFPVLVRSQCMKTQLSDVLVEVVNAEGFQTEIKMKLARRFRLSHREKS